MKYDIRKNKSLFLMMLFPITLLVVFQYVPLYGIQVAFKDYKPIENIWDAKWVGFQYFVRFFQYKGLRTLLKNTLILNIYNILLTPFPLIFALSIHYSPFRRLKKWIQTVSVIPNFFSIVVVCELTMRFFSIDGSLNFIRSLFGKEPVNFLAQGKLFSSIYAWSGVWQTCGYSAIIYLSVLANISKEQREAATIDGANLFQKMIYLDIPGVLPMYAVNLIFQCGSLLNNNFEKILLLQNNMNLPYSQVILTYTYDIAFNSIVPQYSLAMAVGIITSIINMTLLLTVKYIVKKWEDINE